LAKGGEERIVQTSQEDHFIGERERETH
jgi:hypothetical protein